MDCRYVNINMEDQNSMQNNLQHFDLLEATLVCEKTTSAISDASNIYDSYQGNSEDDKTKTSHCKK